MRAAVAIPIAAVCVLVLCATEPSAAAKPAPGPAPEPAPDPAPVPSKIPTEQPPDAAEFIAQVGAGLESTHGLKLVDWQTWMAEAPHALRNALLEGGTPEEIAANAFRRLLPSQPWPPEEDSPIAEQWPDIVAAIGRVIEKPFRPRLDVVS